MASPGRHLDETQDGSSPETTETSEKNINKAVDNPNTSTNGITAIEDLEAGQPPADDPPPYSVFSKRTKLFLVVMTVFATLFSPFSSFIYLPAITPIAAEYGRSIADINLSVTLYQVMQALGPLVFGDLSDTIGRRPVYVMLFVIYIAADIGLALQHSFAALLVLRALQSAGSSATVALGNAVMADFTTRADRGGFIATVQSSIMFAPALAPVLGGILSQFLGWRSTFWFLVIAGGVFLLVYVPWMPETARNVVGNGSVPPPAMNMTLLAWIQRRRLRRTDAAAYAAQMQAQKQQQAQRPRKRGWRRIPVPNVWAAVVLLFEKDIGLAMLYTSIFVMVTFAMLVPLEDVVRKRYGFNEVQVGLCYIPFALGSMVGAAGCGRLLNWNYARIARAIGHHSGDDDSAFPIERARLQLMWPGTALAVAAIVPWGWVVTAGVSLAAPLVVLFFAGVGCSAPVSVMSTLMVDLYPRHPGRISSTFNLARAALSATGTAVVQHMIDAWGYGNTYLFLGLLVAVFSPIILVVQHWGPKWREERSRRLKAGR